FLLEALQAPIDLVEVPEQLGAQRVEALVDRVEALIDDRKALAEESDQLRILGRGHARSLPHRDAAFKCVKSWTAGGSAARDLDPRAALNSPRETREQLGHPHL